MNRLSILYLISFKLWLAFSGCALTAAPSPDPPRRLLVCWDLSTSIMPAERARWVAQVHALSEDLGTTLWDEAAYDELTILPVHRYTATATAMASQRFSGGEFARNVRVLQRRAFMAQQADLETPHIPAETLRWTDLLGTVPRLVEYLGPAGNVRREVYFFSDMMHSTPGLDFEQGTPFTVETARARARQLTADRGWPRDLLAGIDVHVRLPGTVNGAGTVFSSERLAGVEAFWRALFDGLGASVVSWKRY